MLIWQRRHSPEVWLFASSLMARVLGFVVSLLLTRVLGANALGVYTALTVTSTSLTTPMSTALANNATMLTVRHGTQSSLLDILRAHGQVYRWSSLFASVGCLFMLGASGLLDAGGMVPMALVMVVVIGLTQGQLLTQMTMGISHGADLSRYAAQWVCAMTLLAALTTYPVLTVFGVAGVMIQTTLLTLGPGLILCAWFWIKQSQGKSAEIQSGAILKAEVHASFIQAFPNVAATVVNNATNWVSCIYLAERYHGHAGLGLIAIGLQWMGLMQLPAASLGGRIMRDLAVARLASQEAFIKAITTKIRQSVALSLLASVGVTLISYWIADLYKVDRTVMWKLLAINAVASVLVAVNLVYEKVFYCLGNQRPWFLISLGAYVLQLAVTIIGVQGSLLAIPLGNMVGVAGVTAVVTVYMMRTSALRRGLK
jgi:O-antigen/teichoic acid export membrane protein